jgi:hypothetical protein
VKVAPRKRLSWRTVMSNARSQQEGSSAWMAVHLTGRLRCPL